MTTSIEHTDGITAWQSPNLQTIAGLVHAFSTRLGGVSRSPYASFNLGLHTGDEADRVLENRRRFLARFGFALEETVAGAQVHGARAAVVGQKDRGGGAFDLKTALPDTDGLVAFQPQIALVAYFADCLPVYLVDPVGRRVGIAHAGWRGTVAGVAASTLSRLRHLGSRAKDVMVAMGPCIKPCCYEVGAEVVSAFSDRFGPEVCTRTGAGRPSVDLARANAIALQKEGIPPQNIDVSNLCTACRTDLFFSHRVEGPKTGRMAAVIGFRA